MTIEKVIEEVLNDVTTSDWLKSALRSALSRDMLDAANDAEFLFAILSKRLNAIFHEHSEIIAECVPL